jgi:hypothetical protein
VSTKPWSVSLESDVPRHKSRRRDFDTSRCQVGKSDGFCGARSRSHSGAPKGMRASGCSPRRMGDSIPTARTPHCYAMRRYRRVWAHPTVPPKCRFARFRTAQRGPTYGVLMLHPTVENGDHPRAGDLHFSSGEWGIRSPTEPPPDRCAIRWTAQRGPTQGVLMLSVNM